MQSLIVSWIVEAVPDTVSCLAPFTFASHRYEAFHLLMPLYVCRKWQGLPEARHATALKWVKPAHMYALDMPPADLPLIGLLDSLI